MENQYFSFNNLIHGLHNIYQPCPDFKAIRTGQDVSMPQKQISHGCQPPDTGSIQIEHGDGTDIQCSHVRKAIRLRYCSALSGEPDEAQPDVEESSFLFILIFCVSIARVLAIKEKRQKTKRFDLLQFRFFLFS
jgi:hypothetical protein